MADRYAFQSPFSRGDGDPWFHAGSVPVTTTVAITGLGVLAVLVLAIEGGIGTILGALTLKESAISGGQLWRFVTWPIPPESDFFWALLGLLFFFFVGTQFESMLGRRAYSAFIATITIIPALVWTLLELGTGQAAIRPGLSLLFLGVAAGFAAAFTQARSFFNIPFWVLVAFFYLIRMLAIVANRDIPGLGMLLTTGGLGLVLTRSLGFADSVPWIPTVALPSAFTGSSSPKRPSAPRRRKKIRSKNKAGLRAVPTPSSSDAEIDALLDQVNELGIDSLTKQQKATLERHAKEMRRRRDER